MKLIRWILVGIFPAIGIYLAGGAIKDFISDPIVKGDFGCINFAFLFLLLGSMGGILARFRWLAFLWE